MKKTVDKVFQYQWRFMIYSEESRDDGVTAVTLEYNTEYNDIREKPSLFREIEFN